MDILKVFTEQLIVVHIECKSSTTTVMEEYRKNGIWFSNLFCPYHFNSDMGAVEG